MKKYPETFTPKQKKYLHRKYKIDQILGIVASIVFAPVLAVLALLIFIDDPGPVIFKQKRVGNHKTYFNILKFRTMKVETPKDVPTHLLENPDQYITRMGHFLRKTSLDELSQLINIAKGEICICGPRPALWNQYDLIEERDKYGANDIKPGLTGWAQINGRDELEIDVKAALDGEYVEKLGPVMDAKCFFGTFASVLKSEGVVEGGTGAMEAAAAKEKDLEKEVKVLLVANVAKEHVLKFHVPTIKKLAESGWTIDVACSGNEEIPYCSTQYKLSYKRSPFNLALFKGIKELKGIIDKNEYDIVYCHTPVGGLAARLASIKARKKGTKVIYFAHGYHFFKGAPKKNWMIYYTMEKVLSYFTDSIITINNEDYNLTKSKFKSCNAYLIDGIGIDLERFKVEDPSSIRKKYRKAFHIPEDAVVLVYLAELLKNKNQTMLLDALKEVHKSHENVYLVLAGIDHWSGYLQKYAKKLGIRKNVRFLGWRDDVANLYTMSDICTASSIREGFGLNLVEAMQCSLPVIASSNRGHETIIKDGVNGYLVSLDDVDTLVVRINEVIENPQIREEFVEYNNNEVRKYDAERIVECLMSIFECHM